MQMWHIFGLHWLSAHSTHTMQLHQMPDMGGHFLKEHVLNVLIVLLQIFVPQLLYLGRIIPFLPFNTRP